MAKQLLVSNDFLIPVGVRLRRRLVDQSSLLKAAKGEIDPQTVDPAALRHAMHPLLLTAWMHQQKVAIGEC